MLEGGISQNVGGAGSSLLSAGLGAIGGPIGALAGGVLGSLFGGGGQKTAQNIAPAPNWMPFAQSIQLPSSQLGPMNLPSMSVLPQGGGAMMPAGGGYAGPSMMSRGGSVGSNMPAPISGVGSNNGGSLAPLSPAQQAPNGLPQPTSSAPQASSSPIAPLYTPQGQLQGYVASQPQQQGIPMQTANEQNPIQAAATQGLQAVGQAAAPFVDTLGQVFGGQPAEAAPAQGLVQPPAPPPVPAGGYLASPPSQFGQPVPNVPPPSPGAQAQMANDLQSRMDKQAAVVNAFLQNASQKLAQDSQAANNIANGARLITNDFANNQVNLFNQMVQSGKVTSADIDNGIKAVGKNAAKAWDIPLASADKLTADSTKALQIADSFDGMLQNNMQAINNLSSQEHYANMLTAQLDAEEAMIGQNSPFVKGTKQYSRGQMRLARAARIGPAVAAAIQQEIANRHAQNEQLMAASKHFRDMALQNQNASVSVRAARAQDIAAAQKTYLDGAGLVMKNVGVQMGARAADISNYLEANKQQLENVYSDRQATIGFANAGMNASKEAYSANLDAYKMSQQGLFQDRVASTAAANAYAQMLNSITNASKAANGLGLQPDIAGLNRMFPEQAGLIQNAP